MMRRIALISALFVAGALAAAPVAAASPGAHGCAAFGANVAGLATALGSTFGQTVWSVASSAPKAFPTVVVHPEQAFFCS